MYVDQGKRGYGITIRQKETYERGIINAKAVDQRINFVFRFPKNYS